MTNSYVNAALVAFNVELNPVIESFFADKNFNIIQSALIRKVLQHTGKTISKQSCTEIRISARKQGTV